MNFVFVLLEAWYLSYFQMSAPFNLGPIYTFDWKDRNSNMKEFGKIDATTFLMLRSPPRPARPKAPLDMYDDTGMACFSCKCHVMSYMDMMPRSWQDIPCSDMTCHTWTCHGHGTSCHVPISCDHDIDKLHMKQVLLPTHFQPFISRRLVSKLLSVSKSWPPLYPCGENVKRWNLQWH